MTLNAYHWSPAMTDTFPLGPTKEVSHGGKKARAVSVRVLGAYRRAGEGRAQSGVRGARVSSRLNRRSGTGSGKADLDEGRRSDRLTTEARKKMRELKRENKRLRMERDISNCPRSVTSVTAMVASHMPRPTQSRASAPVLTLLALLLAQPPLAKSGTAQEASQRFRDCPTCPEMVVLSAGTFIMGSPESEDDRLRFVIDEAGAVVHWLVEALKTADGEELGHGAEWEGHRVIEPEGPQRYVTFASPFAISIAEITFAEWNACARAGGCGGLIPDNEGWGRGSRPVINVSWEDAQAYVEWLSDVTGEQYSLPSEAQWEYAARAGTETARFWGRGLADQCLFANGADVAGLRKYPDWNDGGAAQCSDGYPETAPVRSFEANGFGLHDMLGNVSEWTRDCWNERYAGGPVDGTAWESGDCSRRVTPGWLVDQPSRKPPRGEPLPICGGRE